MKTICQPSCQITLFFIIANICVNIFAHSTTNNYRNSLNKSNLTRLEKIKHERLMLATHGFILGATIAFIVMLIKYKSKLSITNRICQIGAITFTIQVFYYLLSKKSDYMILHLNKRQERKQWLDVYKRYQFSYYGGLSLGIVGLYLICSL